MKILELSCSKQYLSREEAKRLIEDEGEKPLDVYMKVGFKNLSHFSTAFKRQFGFTPSSVAI